MDDSEARTRLTRLWLDHKAAVEGFVRRRSDVDVDDVVQQVFVTAWRRLEDVPEQPRAWLLTVARNALLNQNRANQRRVALAVRLAGMTPPAGEAADGDPAELKQAWIQLSEAEREVLALIGWDGLSGAAAAQVLGISRPAFAMRLGRARRHLSSLMAGAIDRAEADDGLNTRPSSSAVGRRSQMATVSRPGPVQGDASAIAVLVPASNR